MHYISEQSTPRLQGLSGQGQSGLRLAELWSNRNQANVEGLSRIATRYATRFSQHMSREADQLNA